MTPSTDSRPPIVEDEKALRPVLPRERIASIDVLRGFAVLGILLMNVLMFALPMQAFDNPTVAGGGEGWNLAVWAFHKVLIKGAVRTVFSMLFGAGVVLLTARAEARGGEAQVADVYYRRTVWLILFGVVHAYVLLWPGDILFAYGIAGLFLFPLRKLSPRALLIIGLLVLAVGTADSVASYFGSRSTQATAAAAKAAAAAGETLTEEQKQAQESWERRQKGPSAEVLQKEIDKYRSGYGTVFKHLVEFNVYWQSSSLYQDLFWDVGGMMLLGMGLFKLGVFSARLRARYYLAMAVAGYGIGVAINAYLARNIIAHDFDVLSRQLSYTTYDLARLAVGVGHLSMVMLLFKTGWLGRLASAFAAAGRMALTNYVGQTVICTLLFYGYGFGLFGALERYELYYVVGAIWIFQLITSPIWLRYFRFGPCEWVWRSLTYWERQPFRTRPPGTPAPDSA